MSIEEFQKIPHFLYDYVEKYAAEKPEDVAIIDADDGKFFSWTAFKNAVDMIAIKLFEDGWKKGDIIVSMLPLIPEHIFFEYACFRLGIIFCPLDVRLKRDELIRCIKFLKDAPKIGFIHPDDTESTNKRGKKKFYPFKQYARAVREECPFVKNFIQFSPVEDVDLNSNTEGVLEYTKDMKRRYLNLKKNSAKMQEVLKEIEKRASMVKEDDPILIIYTTGTTGFPKPAMLTNVGIVAQNLCLSKGFGMTEEDRMLVNLPPSHVGCQTEQLMTNIFVGGIAVILHAFKADKTLQAIEEYKVTMLGQIPSLFMMEWYLPMYKEVDLSSLRFALYGGQAVSRRFLEKMSSMAPNFGSGLGLTELSGFCSYTPYGKDVTVDDILESLGHDFPITPLSIRDDMNEDGSAGEEKTDGVIGEVCYTGPQVFKGYYNNEVATRKTISTDGVCYTGDLGFKDEKGLHLVGRGKFVIKPKGYQVYPPEVEKYLEKMPQIYKAAVVGHRHEVFSEGVVAFIQLKYSAKGKITAKDIKEHCADLTGYKRPSLYVFLDEIPLNRVDKTDYKTLNEEVKKYVQIPIALKISYYSSNLGSLIQQLSHSGIDGLVLFNRFYSPDIDINNFNLLSSHVLSQPGEIAMPLRWIGIMADRAECDLAASTGIHDGEAVIKQLLAGAKTVQVASTIYKNGKNHIKTMLQDIENWMDQKGYNNLEDFRGKLTQMKTENPAAYYRMQFMKHFAGKGIKS